MYLNMSTHLNSTNSTLAMYFTLLLDSPYIFELRWPKFTAALYAMKSSPLSPAPNLLTDSNTFLDIVDAFSSTIS